MPLEITGDELKNLPDRIRTAHTAAHKLLALDLWGNIRKNSPVDHGRLAGSWELETDGLESTVSTNVKYALIQEEGSSPYDIYPSGARALRFVIGGTVIYAKSVHHPGVPGKHYVEQSIEATTGRIEELVDMALSAEGLV